jgi:hypothetical protein
VTTAAVENGKREWNCPACAIRNAPGNANCIGCGHASAQPEAVVHEVSVTSTLPADWLPVQTMSTAQLIVQRTNLARFWLVSRIRARLLEIQVELDARLGERP